MAAKSLVLLGLLAAVSIAASKCQWFEFQCKNGTQCVPAYRRCSGVSDCRDGSDLDGCLETNAVALPANALVMARVQFAAAHVLIRIHLCGDQHCSSVDLWGVGDDGKLRYETWTGSNRFGWEGNPFKDNKEGSRNFSPGEVVLEAEHRPGRLAVWRQGLPDDVVEVPVEENNGTLRVWPWNWGTDMPVQFLAASKCTWSDFRCKDGNGCVPGYWRCNGNSDCGDGSDEEGCDAHSVLLPANAAVTARVQYVESHELIGLRLCGGHSCSDVWLWGVGDEGTLRYRTFTGCNEFGFNGYLVKDHKEGSRAFPPGELVLEAEHRSGRLAVWRHSRPDDVVEVPVEEDYDDDTLRVRPWNWGTNMTVHFIVTY